MASNDSRPASAIGRRSSRTARGPRRARGLALGACGKAREAAPADPPAKVEQIVVAGSKHQGVRLTEQAARRLDVQTAPVATGVGGKLVIPAAAVEYNNDGSTFTYTNPSAHFAGLARAVMARRSELDVAYVQLFALGVIASVLVGFSPWKFRGQMS